MTFCCRKWDLNVYYTLMQHLQQSLCLLRRSLVAREGPDVSGLIVVDPFWQEQVLRKWKDCGGKRERITADNVVGELMHYFAGRLPDENGRSCVVQNARILAPFNYMNKHWIVLLIVLVWWRVEVLDQIGMSSRKRTCRRLFSA